MTCLPDPVRRDGDHGADEDDEVENVHENVLISAVRRSTQSRNAPTTKT
jgi:hypothetical protein